MLNHTIEFWKKYLLFPFLGTRQEFTALINLITIYFRKNRKHPYKNKAFEIEIFP